MQYIQGRGRHQTYFSTLERQVSFDNPPRFIDGFVDKCSDRAYFTLATLYPIDQPPGAVNME